MIKHALGNTGYTVSGIAYGGIVSMNDGQNASDNYVSWALEQGINYFDVAPTYGDAQEKLGNSLRPHRKDVYLACKTEQRLCAGAQETLKRSMELLHTDYFDVYQIHGISTMQELEQAFGPGGVMDLMVRVKQEGIARKVGITVHNEKAALRALEWYDFDTVLFPFNWHMHMAHGMGAALLTKAKEKGTGILCMKSMIERAWDDSVDAEARQKFSKSWCKPIDPDADGDWLLSAVKYAANLGVDVIIPPGNFRHFRFAVDNADHIFAPLTDPETALLREKLPFVQDRPFFAPDYYTL